MTFLIVSSTSFELEHLLKNFSHASSKGLVLDNYTFMDHSVDVLITGPGMTATAFWLGKNLTQNKYDLVFNFGIAGSFDSKVEIGDVVHVTKERFSDLGAEDGESFLTLLDLNLQKKDDFPFFNGEIINDSALPNTILNALPMVDGITVNTVHGNALSIRKVIDKFRPMVESMEGAAFFFACLTEKVPCFQVRAISNKVELRNKDSWNIPLAIQNLNDKALEIINCL